MNVVPGDVNFQANIHNVITSAGAPYNPNPTGTDVTVAFMLRWSDHGNCTGAGCTGPYTSPGTVIDFDFTVPVNCDATGECSNTLTSFNAVVSGGFHAGDASNLQLMRVRAKDSGTNAVSGDSDDKEFAQQGLFMP